MRFKLLLAAGLALCGLTAQAQYQVKGVVEDALGPVIGATVMEAGTSNGTSTGLDGDFVLQVSKADAIVEVSCIGYATQSFTASAFPAKVILAEDTNFLDEVVVVGYGTQRAKDLTAPIVNVKGDELSKQVAANPMSALQGMVSGVQITQSGAPGAGPSVKIRGVGSIGDYANPLYIVDGAFMDNIDFLSASDIESLTVLKDASAAAIYGVRAANGVILVTTKKGETGRVRVAYDGYAGLQVPTNIMPMASASQYIEMYNLANPDNPFDTVYDTSKLSGESTDWYRTMVRNALTHSHSLDLSGGTDKTNYSVSMSYFYQDGIMNYCTNDYNRLNFRARLDQTLTSWLKVGFNTVVSRYNRNNPNSSVYYQAFVNPPVYGVYNEENTDAYPVAFDSPQRYGFAAAFGNPAASAYYYHNTDNGVKTVFSAYAEATITPKLKFKTSYNLDFSFADQQNYTPEHKVGGSQGTSVSTLSKTYSYGLYHILDNTLTYADKVGAHDFSAMLGQSTRMQYNGWITGTVHGVPDFDDASRYLRNGSYKNQSASDGASRYNGVSFFARGTYNYKEKYLATATLRADGSSKYQEKWGVFPSLGLGWNISDEDFMKGVRGLDYLKLRASWGMLGNDNVPANDINIAGTSGVDASAVFGDTLVDGMGAQTVYQNYLRWEVVTETNAGADFAMLDSRLSGELDWYRRVTDRVVFHAPIATGGGVATLLANNGKVLNTGVEFSIKWADKLGDLAYNIGMNATFNHNEVLALEGRDNIPGGEVNGVSSTLTQVGYPIGAFWGYQVDGIFQSKKETLEEGVAKQSAAAAGYFRYHDFAGADDGGPDGKITEADRVYLGSPLPWLMLGFNLGANWRNWDFSMVMNANIGNKIFNAKRLNKQVFGAGNYDYDFYINAWSKDLPSDTYPSPKALTSGLMAQANSFWIEDGSMFRIQNVQLGYTFRNLFGGGERLRVYVSAQRPLTLFGYNGFTTEIGGSPIATGIDSSSVYPMQAIYTAGINLNL